MNVEKIWNGKSGVYKISFVNKCYIGSTVDLYMRLAQHISHLRANKHHSIYMQRCYNKYGEDQFSMEILEYCENNVFVLREKELHYMNVYTSDFNSTTPIYYEHSLDMKKRISETLKRKYKSGEIINPRLGKGARVDIFNHIGENIHKNVTIQEATDLLNLSNDSVIRNNLRSGRAVCKKKFLVMPTDSNILFSWIEQNKGKNIPMFQVFEDRRLVRCTPSTIQKILDKVVAAPNYTYYSKKNKSYYTFIGNIINCPFYK
jgi:group I intron endonuclease